MQYTITAMDQIKTAPSFETSPYGHCSIPTIDGEYVSLESLRQQFYNGPVGEAMRTQAFRYSKNYPMSRETALAELGADVCPVGHQLELADIHMHRVIEAEHSEQTLFSISQDDEALLAFVATFHDIGEREDQVIIDAGFIPVGDIPAGTKTDEQRAQEAAIRMYSFETQFPMIEPDFINRADAIIMHQPRAGDVHLYELYEAAHDLQSYDTATNAEQSALFGSLTDEGGAITALAKIVKLNEHRQLSKRTHLSAIHKEITTNPPADSKPMRHVHTADTAPYHAMCPDQISA